MKNINQPFVKIDQTIPLKKQLLIVTKHVKSIHIV